MGKIKIYQYGGCSTCKKALKFLDSNRIPYEAIPIVDRPPTKSELKKMAKAHGDFRKLFNVSGQVYREMKLSERIKDMKEEEAIELLSSQGKLIKRPFLIGDSVALLGFKEEQWREL